MVDLRHAGARPWELGANALATNLSTPLRTLTDLRSSAARGTVTTVDTCRAVARRGGADVLGDELVAGVADASPSMPRRGRLQLHAGEQAPGPTTVTVTARVAGGPDVTDSFVRDGRSAGRAIRFGPVTSCSDRCSFPPSPT